jgi:putative membrane protein
VSATALAAVTKVDLRFHAHPSVVLVIGGLAAFFWWAFTRLGPRSIAEGEVVATRRQKQWIVAGLTWTFVWSYWPLHDISERYLLLAHMTQHTVFTLVAPACFLLGAPAWLWNWVLAKPVIGPVTRFASRPLVALITFNLFVAGTHWKGILERSLHNELFHFSVHLIMFVGATLMWIPVINRTDGLPKLGAPAKMMYLFAQSIVPTVPASFLVFTKRATYSTYRTAPRLIQGLDAVGDQQLAAAMMKLGAGSLLWGIVGYLFYKWWMDCKEGRADDNIRTVSPAVNIAGMTVSGGRVEDVLTWDQVQAEFDRIDQAAGTGVS